MLRSTSVLGSMLVVWASSGCLYRGEARAYDASDAAAASVREVPVVKAEGVMDCGPAALSSLLAYWGAKHPPSAIRAATGVPTDQPLSAGALRDYARAQGFDAFVLEGKLADLTSELDAGRPVLVGTLKPYAGERWYAHFEVVAKADGEHVVTMDPSDGYREYPTWGFVREWRRAGSVALVVAPRSSH